MSRSFVSRHLPEKFGSGAPIPRKPRAFFRRALFWTPTGLVLFILAVRIALIPFTWFYTQWALDQVRGYKGVFQRVRLHVLGLGYSIEGLKLVESPVVETPRPALFVESLEVRLVWSDLLALHLAADVKMRGVEGRWTISKPVEVEVREKIHLVKELLNIETYQDMVRMFRNLVPFRINRIEARDTKFRIVDRYIKEKPELLFQDLEVTIENITNRRRLDDDLPVIIAAKGVFQTSGKFSIFLTADPLAEQPRFAGQGDLTGLKLQELDALIGSQTGMHIMDGTFDVFAKFRTKDGLIDGTVKPLLKNARIVAADDTFSNKLKAALADVAVDLVSDRVPGRNAVATTIPIRGKINAAMLQLTPAILGVLRNAFVEGLVNGFADMPLDSAPKKQNLLEQAAEALSKEGDGPKAQPLTEPEAKNAIGTPSDARKTQS